MQLRPLADRVIIERIKAEKTSKGGIILPEQSVEKPSVGKVQATGPGKLDKNGVFHEMGVKKGDVVMFGKHAGIEVTVDGQERLIMREEDIIGVYEEESK
jgi:chaperonin GroES